MEGQLVARFHAARVLLVVFCLLSVLDVMQSKGVGKFSVNKLIGESVGHMKYGFRVDLVHRDSVLSPFAPPNITFTERLQRAVKRSQQRLQKLMKMSAIEKKPVAASEDMETPINTGNGEFLMAIAIGTPPLSYAGILDTGSDLTWTQCQPCSDCYSQPTPIYDPSKSSTFSKVPCQNSLCRALPASTCTSKDCEYLYTYGDFSSTMGILSFETFTLTSKSGAKNSIPNIAFGCGEDNEGNGFSQGGGIIGLGRGSLSLITQLGSAVANKFSYCLMSIDDSPSKTSPLIFGEAAGLKAKVLRSTPMLQSKSQPTFYYLSLEGISVGGKLLKIPAGTFDLHSDGTGGVIIDSGTTITYLEQAGYDVMKKALTSLIKLPKADGSTLGLDLCYKPPPGGSIPSFPSLTFHFKGADYDLPKDNYMVLDKTGLLCLAMLPNTGMSIFGNVQQQNYHILFDNGNSMLSFAPAVCDTL
eukprot:Gb_23858 [translate_table: standard]